LVINNNQSHNKTSKNTESKREKKTLVGPQYIDIDISKSMPNSNNSTVGELDNNYGGLGNDEFDDDGENVETVRGITDPV